MGIRLVLARTMYDWDGAPKRYRETPADAARRVRELIAAHRHDDTVTIQPAPHSPHGASPAMIRAGWEVAEAEDTVFHIHVAEGQYEGERTLREHGATPIRYLDRLGVLGPRMIGVHCVLARRRGDRADGRAGRRAGLLPGSNMFLGDGITRIPEMLKAGVRIGLGTDGGCTNNRALGVRRDAHVLAAPARAPAGRHRAVGRDRVRAGARATAAGLVGLEAGVIAAGQLADLVAIDLGHLSLQPRNDLLKSVVYAMSPQAVTDVWVHGRRVVEQRTTDDDRRG